MDTVIIQDRIYEIRGKRVVFDFDLAEMYGIENRRLKEQVRVVRSVAGVQYSKIRLMIEFTRIAVQKRL